LKSDIGLSDISSTVDLELMMVLLSMKQFKLLSLYGGKEDIRVTQQAVNSKYKNYTGIIPTDGLYGREMNTALIQVLQAVEGFTPAEATGNF
ncbi:peptidoglycan-binding protein, partial [Bifidobacteriaceae bacterium WP022]